MQQQLDEKGGLPAVRTVVSKLNSEGGSMRSTTPPTVKGNAYSNSGQLDSYLKQLSNSSIPLRPSYGKPTEPSTPPDPSNQSTPPPPPPFPNPINNSPSNSMRPHGKINVPLPIRPSTPPATINNSTAQPLINNSSGTTPLSSIIYSSSSSSLSTHQPEVSSPRRTKPHSSEHERSSSPFSERPSTSTPEKRNPARIQVRQLPPTPSTSSPGNFSPRKDYQSPLDSVSEEKPKKPILRTRSKSAVDLQAAIDSTDSTKDRELPSPRKSHAKDDKKQKKTKPPPTKEPPFPRMRAIPIDLDDSLPVKRGETAQIIGETVSTLEIPDDFSRIEYNKLKDRIRTEDEFNKVFGHTEEIQIDPKKFSDVRNRVAFELYTTEVTYVKSLQVCMMIYLEPINQWVTQNQQGKIQAVIVTKLIQFYRSILQVHTIFLNNLRSRFKNWSDAQKIGDLTITINPMLKMYKLFGEDYENMLKALDGFKKVSSAYRAILKEGDSHPLAKNSLESMLILPIQRLPRYVLLLQELNKRTSDTHPDYVPLQKSLTAMRKTSEELNSAILDCERRSKCMEIHSRVAKSTLPIVEAHRYFVGEYTMDVRGHATRKPEPLKLLLFNDLLLCVTGNSDALKEVYYFLLNSVELRDEGDVSFEIDGEKTAKDKAGRLVSFTAPSKEKKEDIFKIIKNTIDSNKKRPVKS